ncbi:hypothetical protein GCM10009799_07500 [Nocardiopsis rhodophaea]|uniref:Uncharacterized protein n=1 Tax=Nocardiopsis rhodophaea TaxID=280238 RepID=A0ABP5DUB7_9ACTN
MTRISFLLAAAAAMTLSMAAPATAETPAGSPVNRAYAQTDVTTVGAEQCDLPVEERSGNWLCLSDKRDQAEAHETALEAADEATAQQASTHCTSQACWSRYSAISGDFSSAGSFGYGPLVIGKVNVYYRTDLLGFRSTSQPVLFMADTNVSDLTMSGERLSYPWFRPEGMPVRAGATFSSYATPATAAHEVVRWKPNGYRVADQTARVGGVVHQWSWSKPGYPGSWYVYGKSIKFTKMRYGYRYGDVNYLPKEPVRYGWRLTR